MLEAFRSRRNLIVGAVAGQAAVNVQSAAVTLFEAGGKDLLASAAQVTIRKAAASGAAQTVATLAPTLLAETVEVGALIGPALGIEFAAAAATSAASAAAKVTAVVTAKAASRQILRSAVRVGGIGLVIDGAIGAAEGVLGYRKGTFTARQAYVHTATEAATGALSTAAGVVLAAGVVALTGALAIPAITAIGAGGALAAKLGLNRLVRGKSTASIPAV